MNFNERLIKSNQLGLRAQLPRSLNMKKFKDIYLVLAFDLDGHPEQFGAFECEEKAKDQVLVCNQNGYDAWIEDVVLELIQ